jgi:hypothetical protein
VVGRDRAARFLTILLKRMVGFGADTRVANVNGVSDWCS